MGAILHQIEEYWSKRADSFADGMFEPEYRNRWRRTLRRELKGMPPGKGISVLDIGTGPGFFAILLAEEGYQVTAVDYTQAMLDKARENAGSLKDRIFFFRMDAHHLEFPDNCFDVIVTRNLTWNLEDPQMAYREWKRVLKKGGVLLNFDAPWYEYLFDEEKADAYARDRQNTLQAGLVDGSISYSESPVMEDISRKLICSRLKRPGADLQMLLDAGYSRIAVNMDSWKETWSDEEKIMYASTPEFMLRVVK